MGWILLCMSYDFKNSFSSNFPILRAKCIFHDYLKLIRSEVIEIIKSEQKKTRNVQNLTISIKSTIFIKFNKIRKNHLHLIRSQLWISTVTYRNVVLIKVLEG